MHIKIGEKIYNPAQVPIMFIFDNAREKKRFGKELKVMGNENMCLCKFPATMTDAEVEKFMKPIPGAKLQSINVTKKSNKK